MVSAPFKPAAMFDDDLALQIRLRVRILTRAIGEHLFERHRMAEWSESAVSGELGDDSTLYMRGNDHYRVPLNFFTVTLTQDARPYTGPAAGSFKYFDFRSRIMNCLGTRKNRVIMSLVLGSLNIYKEQVSSRLPVNVEL